MRLCRRAFLLLASCLLLGVPILGSPAAPGAAPGGPVAWDTYSDTWVGVDGLGRALPTYAEVGGPRRDKQAGIFYYLWLGGDNASGPFNNTEILRKDPDALDKPGSPLWGGLYSFHYWDQPLFGYYSMQDPFIVRAHAQMLSDAGIDMLLFDVSNGYNYEKTVSGLLAVYLQMRAEGSPTPTLQAALGDAAWMTGMERNSDVVVLESYAPLLVNVNPGARQWGTNLIGYDALSSFGSPSYYVQKMFGTNRGDVILPVTLTPQGVAPVAVPPPSGKIGVATWATQAEFKDIQVTQGGQTLYAKDFAQGDADWALGQGAWTAGSGVLRQTDDQEGDRATAGDTAWTDYTYHVRARKLGGREGFLIPFHYRDDANLVWWNIGGWGNTRTAIEQIHNGVNTQLGPDVPLTVEPNRWYDIKIEAQGRAIRCYLDAKLIEETTDTPPAPPAPLYAVASRALKTGDVILKVVNTSPAAQQLQVDLQGARGVAKTAVAQTLTGDPADVNSVDAPEKVAPQTTTLTGIGPTFAHEFPAHSVTSPSGTEAPGFIHGEEVPPCLSAGKIFSRSRFNACLFGYNISVHFSVNALFKGTPLAEITVLNIDKSTYAVAVPHAVAQRKMLRRFSVF